MTPDLHPRQPSIAAANDVDERFRRFCTDGDTDALADVFAAVAPWLTRRAMQLTGDPLLAMDLVQGTFVTAIEIRSRFDAAGKARPWLRGILENKARRPSARITRPGLAAVDALDPATPDDDPADHAVRGELAAIVQQAIERLPDPYRAVLQRNLLHDETAEQIADALARPQATVRSQVRRGLERLRRALPAGFGALLRALQRDWQGATLAVAAGAVALVLAAVAYLVMRESAPEAASSSGATAAGPGDSASAEPEAAPVEASTAMRLPLPLPPSSEVSAAVEPAWTLAVRQVDDTHAADVEFVLVWRNGERQRVVSDAAGLAHVVTAADTTGAIVEAPFAGVRCELAERAPAAGAPRDTLVLPPGFSVAGLVVDEAGRPVASASVVWIDDDEQLQVARSDAEGRFLVRQLRSARTHRLRAVLGSRGSAEAQLSGTTGTTAAHTFRLDREATAPATSSTTTDEPMMATAPLTVEFLATDGTVVHGWLAVLSATTDDVVAARPIVGNIATFPPVPMTGLRCTLLPPEPDGGAGPRNDARLLTRRHGSVPRAVQRRGERAVFEVRGDELPSAWLRLTSASANGAPLAERAVLLDRSGRPHGIFLRPADGIGPILPGTWTLALLSSGHETEYRGPLEVAAGGVYAVADVTQETPAVVRLRGADGLALDPPLEALWICAADVVLTLEPRRNLDDDLHLAPGDYVVYWRQRGPACANVAVRAKPGEQDLVLSASSGSEFLLEFDYGRVDAADGRVARLDVTVRDAAGTPLWRERLHAPTDADGRLRALRRLGVGSVLVEAIDANGARGSARLRPGEELARIVMMMDGDNRPR